MRTGRPKKPLEIQAEDREKLNMIARRPKSAQAMAMRARIVLGCEQGMNNSEVARKVHVSAATVGKWRERFREFGLDGLLDEPRVGAPRKITDQKIEEVVTKTLESMPSNSTHWSTRLMAQEMGLSQNAIVRIWRAFGLQPHRVENFKFSKDPQFVEKVRDIVALYLNPPDRAIVLCVDEKSQVQALNRTEPILPLAPGVPARQSHDYERHGVRATGRRLVLAVRRSLLSSHMVLFYCDLAREAPARAEFQRSVRVEPKRSISELSQQDLTEMTSFWNPSLAHKNINERFQKGAILWMIKAEEKLAGYGWTLQGNTIEPHYFHWANRTCIFSTSTCFHSFGAEG